MPHGLTTAPANPAPQRPAGYGEALWEAGVREKAVPFCIRRGRGLFAEHPGRRRLPVRDRTQAGRDLGRTEIEALLRKVAAHPNVANGQVQQARESLAVHHERFRGIALLPRPAAAATPSDGTPTAPVRGATRPSPSNQGSGTVGHPAQS